MRTIASIGPGSVKRVTEASAPRPIAHGSGLASAPRSARAAAARPPWPEASCACARPMHSELVTSRSISSVVITGAAAAGPSSAAISGTPMKPLFGNAATSAPNAASFKCTRGDSVARTVAATISSAAAR